MEGRHPYRSRVGRKYGESIMTTLKKRLGLLAVAADITQKHP